MNRYSAVVPGSEHPLNASFESFYRSSRPRIYRAVALAIADGDLALDATEEAMTRAATGWSEVGRYDNPAGWVYRVAVNWARSKLRRWGRERGELVFEPGYTQKVPDPELVDAVLALPIGYRTVIVARFFLDLSVAETAEVLQIPQGTVKTRTARALARLRRVVEET